MFKLLTTTMLAAFLTGAVLTLAVIQTTETSAQEIVVRQ